ncbi:cation tolerance protein CutA [Streptomyces sp. 150FB]|uniref:divalent-cation tolerance protein CutA n=1 Tax=Streptomyces sp. 150FB TaxID=1576605 RepID=UPI0005894E99|nr:divalent-cation tolerance protein CutA [Streptomyces sp. 150FB]KIF73827.1 cation tolerance protein CutA [Streptomyces sp. 150FB]
MTDFVQVSTATETRDQAIRLAETVVRERLAAGVQIVGPVTSVFWHLGEFGTGEEWQLLLKTTTDRYPALEAHLLEHHPWENPEVSAVAVVAGTEGYLRWVAENTEPVQTTGTGPAPRI